MAEKSNKGDSTLESLFGGAPPWLILVLLVGGPGGAGLVSGYVSQTTSPIARDARARPDAFTKTDSIKQESEIKRYVDNRISTHAALARERFKVDLGYANRRIEDVEKGHKKLFENSVEHSNEAWHCKARIQSLEEAVKELKKRSR